MREIEKGKYIVVVYKEVSSSDGFIITAFLRRRMCSILRSRVGQMKQN